MFGGADMNISKIESETDVKETPLRNLRKVNDFFMSLKID